MSNHTTTRVYQSTKTQAAKNLKEFNRLRAIEGDDGLTMPEYLDHLVSKDAMELGTNE